MTTKLNKLTIRTIIAFICIILSELGVMMVVTGETPNQLEFTFIEKLNFFINIVSISPGSAANLILIDTPVVIIQKIAPLTNDQIWGMYLMPISLIIQIILSIFIAWISCTTSKISIWLWTGVGSVLLVFSVLYLKLLSCCTTGPTWCFEIWLFSQVNDPMLNTYFWQGVYMYLSPWFTVIQLTTASIALFILALCSNKALSKPKLFS